MHLPRTDYWNPKPNNAQQIQSEYKHICISLCYIRSGTVITRLIVYQILTLETPELAHESNIYGVYFVNTVIPIDFLSQSL